MTEVIESLYCLNKYAKKYARESKENYDKGYKERARYLSIRKSALYDYKSHIIKKLYEKNTFDDIEGHRIDNSSYFCFYVNDYSFHLPIDDINIRESIDDFDDITDEFSSNSTDYDYLKYSERDVLEILNDEYISANNFVNPKFLNTNYTSNPICWKYLDSYVSEGDNVSEEKVYEDKCAEEFVFNEGDLFETVQRGEVQILDKYGSWINGHRMNDDLIRIRPVYDIRVEDKFMESVRQDRILDEWKINLIDTINCEGVIRISSDKWIDFKNKIENIPNFELGDVLEFKDGRTGNIRSIETNYMSMIFVEIEFDEFSDYLTPDKFINDLKNIQKNKSGY